MTNELKRKDGRRVLLWTLMLLPAAGLAATPAASGAQPQATTPPATADILDEVVVMAEKERERQRGLLRTADPAYTFYVWHRDGKTRIHLSLLGIRQGEVRFRRESGARRLTPGIASARTPVAAARLSGDRITGFDGDHTVALLTLDANVDELDGLPASIPFGPHASLVNLDHLRLRDTRSQTHITVLNGIYPQTRRCDGMFALLDDGLDNPYRFILLSDSPSECQRAERSREGDLLIAASVPESLRQAVVDVYNPIAARIAHKLGGEPGLVFVAWWPDSPHEGVRFERSWNRNSLLLFNGAEWQRGLDQQQREALRTAFTAEQIQRRFRPSESPGAFTASAASYLLTLVTAEQAGNTRRSLADSLPGWIAGCARHLNRRSGAAASRNDLSSVECGLVVQFVYDAVARTMSTGRDSLYDTWRRLLTASYRRGESGAKPAAFLDSSKEAHRIVQGVLDGSVDWTRFAAELDGLGVRLRLNQDANGLDVSVLSLTHFHD